jgi:hypothetical protein
MTGTRIEDLELEVSLVERVPIFEQLLRDWANSETVACHARRAGITDVGDALENNGLVVVSPQEVMDAVAFQHRQLDEQAAEVNDALQVMAAAGEVPYTEDDQRQLTTLYDAITPEKLRPLDETAQLPPGPNTIDLPAVADDDQ